MLGVVQNPTFTDADKIMKEVADDMGVGDTFVRDARRGVLRAGRHQGAGQDRARPVLRRRRAGPHRLHRVRLLHDGLPLRRQEHLVKNYLGLAETAGAQVHPMTTVTGFKQRPDGLWEVKTARTGTAAAPQASHLHRQSRHPRRGHVRHAEAAVQDARPRQSAEAVGQTRRADPNQLRVDRRRRAVRGARRPRPHPRCGDHVVDPPDLRHPRRALPLRQGVQRDGPAADADDRRRRSGAAATSRGGGSCWTRRARTPRTCCGCSTRAAGASGR